MSDNVIPEYAVPFSEAYGGPQFIARTFLEVRLFSFFLCVNLISTLLGRIDHRVNTVGILTYIIVLGHCSQPIVSGIGKAGTGLPLGALITYAGRQLTVSACHLLRCSLEQIS